MTLIFAAMLATAIYSEERDPITDTQRAFVSISEGKRQIGFGCDKSTADGIRAWVTYDRYLVDTGIAWQDLIYRVNDRPPVKSWKWRYRGDAVVTSETANVARFARELEHGGQVTIRAAIHLDENADMAINVQGFSEAFEKLRATCASKWFDKEYKKIP
jgi:hypothetical protein